MKYYQLFYNATECGLSGKSGFGVRTATEGIPQEFINAVEGDEFLHIYPNEDYGIKDSEIASNPERISEYPRTYYFRRLPIADGREVFMVGRIVYAMYDYSFYSGTSKRTGNLINHIYLFEEKPDSEVFDMLLESPADNATGFLPRNWAPRADNPEMIKLMLGKPERLPEEDKPFLSSRAGISDKAYTLFFQTLEFRNNNKPILVRAKAAETGEIIAGLMRLLPDKIARDLTFVTNHQDNGLAKGVRITFVNEFYPNQIYTASCDYVDLIDGEIAPSMLEKTYRKALEALDDPASTEERAVLSDWICSGIAARNVSRPQEFNLALFNYAHKPEAFSYDDLDKNDGLIVELSGIIGNDSNKAEVLNMVLADRLSVCESAEDYGTVIGMVEKCRNAGIPVASATEACKKAVTEKMVADINYMSSCLSVIGESLLERFSDKTALPKLEKVLPEIVKLNIVEEDKKKLIRYLEPNAKQRVACCVSEIGMSPQNYESYRPLLEMDKTEADEIEWLKILKDSYAVDDISGLLFAQLQRHPKETREQVTLYSEISAKNPSFRALVINNAGSIYSAILSSIESRLRPSEFTDTEKLIQEKISPFIKEDIGISKRCDRLCRVMNADFEKVERPGEYWSLAVKINAEKAQKKLIPTCFGTFEDKESIYGFVQTLLSRGILGKDEIVDNVCKYTKSDRARALFWRGLKKYGEYSGYDSIYDLGRRMNVPEDVIEEVFKTKYTADYKAHKREVSKKKLGTLLKKKPVWIICSIILLVAIITTLYLTVGQRILPENMRLPKVSLPDSTAISVEDTAKVSVTDSIRVDKVDLVDSLAVGK